MYGLIYYNSLKMLKITSRMTVRIGLYNFNKPNLHYTVERK